MSNFERMLREWLEKNGFNCELKYADEFAYDRAENCLHIGIGEIPDDVQKCFEQFLYEYGMEYIGFCAPMLALLHEIGHSKTVMCFDDEELLGFMFAKFFIDSDMDPFDANIAYWEIPDEFSANMWLIDFVNNHFDEVGALCEIFNLYWDEFLEEVV